MFQQPSFCQNMPPNTIQFTATIHRILQCFLETLRFTVAMFPVAGKCCSEGQQQTADRKNLTTGKLLAPKGRNLKAGLRPSQLVLF